VEAGVEVTEPTDLSEVGLANGSVDMVALALAESIADASPDPDADPDTLAVAEADSDDSLSVAVAHGRSVSEEVVSLAD
jgi:hypothetical protein